MSKESLIEDIYKSIGQNDSQQDVSSWLSTGVLQLNKAVGGSYDRGFPVGRIIEIFGSESCGKTLLATFAIISTQKKGGIGIFLDYEHAFSLSRAKSLGMSDDPDKWIYKQPETAEDGFKIIETVVELVRNVDCDKPITVVIDSIASMLTKDELEADYDESNMKTKLSLPALLSTSLKKLASLINKSNVTLIFLNQLRDNPGVMFGSKEKTPGGRAMKFYASVRIQLVKIGKIKSGEDIIGESIKATIVKNKVFEPFRVAEYQSSFSEGINLYASIIGEAENAGIISKNGAWYEWIDGSKMQRGKLEDMLRSDKDSYDMLVAALEAVE